MNASKYNERLATQAGAAEALGIDVATLGRWERGETVPSNHKVRLMASVYNAPILLHNYCAYACPIGCGRMKPLDERPIERTAISMHKYMRTVGSVLDDLLDILADGEIDADEADDFREIVEKFAKIGRRIDGGNFMSFNHFAVCIPLDPTAPADQVPCYIHAVDAAFPTLDVLHEMVCTDIVEVVHPKYLPEPYVMIVDENGLLREHPVVNRIGSLLYGSFEHGHPIVGNVVFMKQDRADLLWMDQDEATRFVEKVLEKALNAAKQGAQTHGGKRS